MKFALVLALLLAPIRAEAQCTSFPACVGRIPRIGAQTLAKIGAVAAPVIIGVGAFLSVVAEQNRPKEMPEGVVYLTDEKGRTRPALELIPTPRDRYYGEPQYERQPASGAFRVHDTAANVALAVGGAAVIGSIIAGIIKSRH